MVVRTYVAIGLLLVLCVFVFWWVQRPTKKRAPKPPTVQDLHVSRIERLELLFPIGSHFAYLGRDCCVTGHWKWTYSSYDCWRVPRLFAYYSDNHGVIHTITFSWAEALALAVVTE